LVFISFPDLIMHQLALDEAISFSRRAKESNIADCTGEILANEGIRAATDASDSEWRTEVLNLLYELLVVKKEITADDLNHAMENFNLELKYPNALGGIFREAAKRKWCRKTDKYIASDIPRKHMRPLRVWASTLYL